MGRPRKPVKQQSGHLKIVEIERRKQEEETSSAGAVALKKPPDAMFANAEAIKEWKRLTKLVKPLDAFDDRDRGNFLAYCNAFGRYVENVQRINDPANVEIISDLLRLERQYLEQMYKYQRLCGLSPEARLKVAATKVDKEEEALEQKYGNI